MTDIDTTLAALEQVDPIEQGLALIAQVDPRAAAKAREAIGIAQERSKHLISFRATRDEEQQLRDAARQADVTVTKYIVSAPEQIADLTRRNRDLEELLRREEARP